MVCVCVGGGGGGGSGGWVGGGVGGGWVGGGGGGVGGGGGGWGWGGGGVSPVTGEFPSQRPVTRSFDVFFDLRLNKRFSEHSWGWWFETPSRPLWRHCNDISISTPKRGHLLKIFTWFTYILRNLSNPIIALLVWLISLAWASHQIRKIACCACAGNAGNVFFRHRLQRKPLVSDPGMHHGTCVTHVPWCMSGSLTHGCGEYVPGIPGACATHKFTYLVRAHCWIEFYLNIELFSLIEKDSQGHSSSWKCRNQIKISPHHPNFPSNSFVIEASNIENG